MSALHTILDTKNLVALQNLVKRIPLLEKSNALLYMCKVEYSPFQERAVNLLLDEGADPNFGAGKPLIQACLRGNTPIVAILCGRGADPNMSAGLAFTTACQHNHVQIVHLLLTRTTFNVAVNGELGTQWALTNNNVAILREILTRLKQVVSKEVYNKKLRSYMIYVCDYDNFEVFKYLYDIRADFTDQALDRILKLGFDDIFMYILPTIRLQSSDLVSAIQGRNIQIVRAILDNERHPIDINYENSLPLSIACEGEDVEIIRLLLSRGANVNPDDGAPLYNACDVGDVEAVRLLILYHVDVNANESESLKLCIAHGHNNIIRVLLEAGATIRHLNQNEIDWLRNNELLQYARDAQEHLEQIRVRNEQVLELQRNLKRDLEERQREEKGLEPVNEGEEERRKKRKLMREQHLAEERAKAEVKDDSQRCNNTDINFNPLDAKSEDVHTILINGKLYCYTNEELEGMKNASKIHKTTSEYVARISRLTWTGQTIDFKDFVEHPEKFEQLLKKKEFELQDTGYELEGSDLKVYRLV